MMLIDSPLPELQIGLRLIVPVTLGISGILLFLVTLAVNAQRARPVTGRRRCSMRMAYALTPSSQAGRGNVRTHGEIWAAVGERADRGR